jgi:hypothetical protein
MIPRSSKTVPSHKLFGGLVQVSLTSNHVIAEVLLALGRIAVDLFF